MSGSWYGLLAILQDVRTTAQQTDMTCPNDGMPYQTDARGALVCPFDGYRPGGSYGGGRPARAGADWGGLRAALTDD